MSITKYTTAKGTRYRVQVMIDGKRISKTFPTRTAAKEFEGKLHSDKDFAGQIVNHTLSTLTLSQAIDEYFANWARVKKSGAPARNVVNATKKWIEWLGDIAIGKITVQAIKGTMLDRLDDGEAVATCVRNIGRLRAVVNYVCREYEVEFDPFSKLPPAEQWLGEANKRTRYLTDNEIARLRAAARASAWPQLEALVLLAITSGGRHGELMGLTWQDVNLDAGTAQLHTSKNGEPRVLVIVPAVAAMLRQWQGIGAGRVFDRVSSQRPWEAARGAAGLHDIVFHDLRHTTASILAKNGASLLEIANVLGHKSIAMTQRYAHLCTNHKQQLVVSTFANVI